jgi:DUF4097 and DUF4098 domain-containing protein YvlB
VSYLQVRNLSLLPLFISILFFSPEQREAGAAQNPAEFHQTYPLSAGGTVSINNMTGLIRVSSWDEDRVRVDAIKKGPREEEFGSVEIQVEAQPNTISIRTVYLRRVIVTGQGAKPDPGLRAGRRSVDVSVDYDIKVPKTALLTPVTSMSGDIQITGPVAQVVARSMSGSVAAAEVSGGAQLISTSGDVTARRVGGALVARSTSGKVVVQDAQGQATATSTSGDVTLRGAGADAIVNSTSGSVRIERVRGRATTRSSSGALTVIDAGGDVSAENNSNSITIQNVQGRVTASTSSGEVIVRGAQAGVRVGTVSGSVQLGGSKGRTDITTTSGAINIGGLDSREVFVKTTSGEVNFDSVIHQDGRYSFESLAGQIVIKIPAQSGFNLSAKTYSGSITTQFPVQVTPGGGVGERLMRGTVGGGGAEVNATSYSGTIFIVKK